MMEYNYNKLLDRAWESLPEEVKKHERFNIPQSVTFVEGNQTIIKNFSEIADLLGRDPKHVYTFLLKELAAPGTLEGNRVVMQRVLRQSVIDSKIEGYANEFVLCHECGKPDTKFTELAGEKIIKCSACGAWRPLTRIK
jgi:translation initiation factor 2 subunit 2